MAGKIDSRAMWNIAAIVGLCVIVLAIGIFIGRTLTMNTPGNTVIATVPPGDDSGVVTQPSASPTITAPATSATPAPGQATLTPTPLATATPVPTARPTNTPTPAPTATPYPTQGPWPTPTPTPTPIPDDFIPDTPFYESITPMKPGDFLPPVSDQNSYDPGKGPIFIDLANSNMGSPYAYPGDTLGIGLKLKNNGPAIDTTARVKMSMQKMYSKSDGQIGWQDYPVGKEFSTRIAMGDQGTMQKNISYRVPTDIPYIEGTYKIYIKFYLYDQYSAGVVKVLTIL